MNRSRTDWSRLAAYLLILVTLAAFWAAVGFGAVAAFGLASWS